MENSVNTPRYIWDKQFGCMYIINELAKLLISEHLGIENFRLYLLAIPIKINQPIIYDLLKDNCNLLIFKDAEEGINFVERYKYDILKNSNESIDLLIQQYLNKTEVTHIGYPSEFTENSTDIKVEDTNDFISKNTKEGLNVKKIIEQRIILKFKRDIIRDMFNQRDERLYYYNFSLPYTTPD
ncbi:MAG: hypothetical protein J0M05_13130, partial [Candidatus Kapabacteria bacterium]|nr:hypothetical protein [Candidatus Kapabacteria bacterium]